MSYSNAVLADKPTAYYRLSETSGTTIADSSGNGYTATIPSSNISYSQAGALIGDTDASMNFTSSATITLPGGITPANSLEFWHIVAAVWQHVVVTVTGSNTLTYINGAFSSSSAVSSIISSSHIMYTGTPITGNLDEISLYNYVITPLQISNHYYQRLSSGGFGLWANGTGTASFDNFFVTEYAPVVQGATRVGQTAILYSANIPGNTTLAIATSTDGVTWTDETSNNGGNVAGIFSQPAPSVDGFSTNSSANYTNTFKTGGGVALWNYDTANTRVTATGGTDALYLFTGVSRADLDIFVDMDLSDAGGVVWRYQDQNNFYFATFADTLASAGTKNTATFYKVLAGVTTTLGTVPLSYTTGTPGSNYTTNFTRQTFRRFRIATLGSTFNFYLDGNILFTYTDASPLGAGLAGLYNTTGSSRYYQLWLQPLGDRVTGTPTFDIVTGTFVYTKATLTTTDPTETPKVAEIATLATTPEINIGATIPSVTYNSASTSSIFDDMVNASGNSYWYIDANKHLFFTQNGTVPAPWIVQSATIGLVSTVDVEVDQNFEVSVGNDLYRNRQTILGAQGTIEGQAATFNGDGNTTSFTLGYPLAATPKLLVNGIAQTVGIKGNTGFQWYYAENDAVIQQDTNYQPLDVTDTLSVAYTGLYDVAITIDDITEQSARKIVEGGSGIVEAVEDHSSDSPRISEATAVVLAQGLLNRYAINGRTLIFTTSRDSLVLGQTVSIFLPEHGLWNLPCLITQIEVKLAKGLGDTQVWWYMVQASELPRQASWAKLLALGLGLGNSVSVS